MKTIAEQIRDLEATRLAKANRMSAIMQKSMDEDRSTDEAESEEFDTLDAEIKSLDQDLVRLKKLEQLSVQRATQVIDTTTTQQKGTELRGRQGGAPMIITNKSDREDAFKGQAYVRRIIARTLAQIDGVSAIAIAQHRWGKSNPQLVEVIKADVAGGGTESGDWGAELVTADGRFTGDFIEFLSSRTIYDQLPLRSVPAHVTIKGQDGAATGYWVGEGKGIPVTAVDFMNVTLTPHKVAALAVMSLELMRHADPSSEQLVRDALVDASAQRIDTTFLSATAASAGVSPAGILNGVTPLVTNGIDEASALADIGALIDPFITAKNSSGLAIVMNTGLATKLGLMRNTFGQRSFPDINEMGGRLEGKAVYVGDNVNPSHLIMLKPSDIYRIDDTGVRVELSRDATIEMSNTPAGNIDVPAAQANKPVNMFQTDSIALKVVRSISFAKRRASAVQYINDADYGAGAS